MIQAGDADIVVAGGMENMSMAPFALPNGRYGYRMTWPSNSQGALVDTMVKDALWDAFNDYHMIKTADNVAEQWGLTREELDEFAANSQQKCEKAMAEGAFKREIVPVEIKKKKETVVFDTDENPRAGITAEGLSRMRAINPDGYVTADSITYQLKEAKTKEGVKTIVSIKQKDGSYKDREDDRTIMHDEQTNVRFIKVDADSGKILAGAKIKVTDKNGKEVMKFTTGNDEFDIIGKLAVGETYTFTEISAPSGYKIAKPVKITILDTAKVQVVKMKDEKIPDVSHVPQTGKSMPVIPIGFMMIIMFGVIGIVSRKMKFLK